MNESIEATAAILEETPQEAPHYIGDVVTKWLRHEGPDRLMELREDFTFVDSRSCVWTAPRGFVFDGTTIPRALWTVFGDPFIGDYRRAAVIHDLICTPACLICGELAQDRGERQKRRYRCAEHGVGPLRHRATSREAADVFREAMLTDGVPELRARVMWRAVERWGPQFRKRTTE